jgi:hypothetical protein
MKFARQETTKLRRPSRSEPVILFSVANRPFAIAVHAVQEIRSTDSLAGTAVEIEQPGLPKVRHFIERGRRTYYVVNGCTHFGLRVMRPTLVLILRQFRAALLVYRIERMAEVSALYQLPRAFTGEERRWYRGLAYLDDLVIPIIHPAGFLSPDDFRRLDFAVKAADSQRPMEGAVPA